MLSDGWEDRSDHILLSWSDNFFIQFICGKILIFPYFNIATLIYSNHFITNDEIFFFFISELVETFKGTIEEVGSLLSGKFFMIV